ncbi:hypothetical protein AGMMS49982_21530 [Bacteroidia bacterium]|nr:hypothetical protein AGMMS49982_21530 [Bacteroidia bacterium]
MLTISMFKVLLIKKNSMLVAMVMSLGVMNGINAKSNDSSLQQVSVGSGIGAAHTGWTYWGVTAHVVL